MLLTHLSKPSSSACTYFSLAHRLEDDRNRSNAPYDEFQVSSKAYDACVYGATYGKTGLHNTALYPQASMPDIASSFVSRNYGF